MFFCVDWQTALRLMATGDRLTVNRYKQQGSIRGLPEQRNFSTRYIREHFVSIIFRTFEKRVKATQ